MIAVDTNILVYAHRADSRWYKAASEAVQGLAESSASWALPWPCVHEFLSVVTHPRIYDPPSSLTQALEQVEAWKESPSLVLLSEQTGYWNELHTSVTKGQVTGPKIHDARVAAICAQSGVRELWTADRDFSRFPALRTRNPLVT